MSYKIIRKGQKLDDVFMACDPQAKTKANEEMQKLIKAKTTTVKTSSFTVIFSILLIDCHK